MEQFLSGEYVGIAIAVYALASEIIGMNPKWKSNSVVQMGLTIFKRVLG